MKQKPVDKLLDWELHGLEAIPVFSIAVSEAHFCVLDREDSIIGQSNPVDVTAEVVEQMLGRTERLFGVDVPRFFSQSFEQQVEVTRIGQGSGFS